jgi:hypothetical protein
MPKTTTKSLSYHDLHRHCWECKIGIVDLSVFEPLEEVRIRTATGDHVLAAVWREGKVLYFDVGGKIDE